jgi:molybdenum cofactor cytidylyltransferase
MKLHEAFEIARGEVVSFTGAGGKTSLMVALGYELAEMGWRVLATTTYRMRTDQLDLMPVSLKMSAGVKRISDALNKSRFVFLYQSVAGHTVYGLETESIRYLLDAVDSDVLLVEADVANEMGVKAPLPGEPAVPPESSLVIPVVSSAVLAQPFDAEHVYNIAAVIERYGFAEGARIKAAWLAQILRDEALGLRGAPAEARVIPYLNQTVSRGYARGRARLVARLTLKSPRFHGVVIGSVRGEQPVYEVQRPVGAVVLAAGLSRRMGQPKVLLPWANNRTILEHIIDQLIRARIDQVTVVTGHQSREVKALLKPLDVDVVYNQDYKTGEMLSSVQAGLNAMPPQVAAALIVLGDQPRIQPKTVYHIMNTYAETASDLIVPSFQMKRGHPLLIGRRYWGEILALRENSSLRDVMNAHSDAITYVNIDNDSILRDIDTPEDYRDERWRSGL